MKQVIKQYMSLHTQSVIASAAKQSRFHIALHTEPGLLRCARNDGASSRFALLFVMGIFLSLLLLTCASANTLPDDEQQIAINSDSFHFDNQTGVATYTGNVLATQGSRRLTGSKLEIYRDEKTGDIDRLITYGEPAKYQGLTDPKKPLLFAEAKVITYTISTKSLTLLGAAQVEQDGDIYRAEQIEYDGLKEIVYSPPTADKQTTIILKKRTSNNNAGI